MDRTREMEKKWKYGWEPFFPNHILKQLILICLLLATLIVLAALAPPPMLPKADPFTTPENIKPEWYFLAAYQFLKAADALQFLGMWVPKVVGVLAQGAIAVLLLFLPFIDKNSSVRPKDRPYALRVGITLAVLYIIFTAWGYFS